LPVPARRLASRCRDSERAFDIRPARSADCGPHRPTDIGQQKLRRPLHSGQSSANLGQNRLFTLRHVGFAIRE
jgi:hypothetical protein